METISGGRNVGSSSGGTGSKEIRTNTGEGRSGGQSGGKGIRRPGSIGGTGAAKSACGKKQQSRGGGYISKNNNSSVEITDLARDLGSPSRLDTEVTETEVDLYRLRSTCKSMCALADTPDVYYSFDLYKYPWWTGLRDTLLRRCYDVGNPSTLYIKGVEYFYALQRHEEGLALMKRAADAGYERALYTYAMTRKLYWDDEEYFASFTREAVCTIGWLVRMEDVPWVPVINEGFLTKKFMFMSTDRPLFYNCPCAPTLDFDRDLWQMELSKTEDMCNRCFWIKEVGLFLRDFRCATSVPPFDSWQ
ncbi:unnamed protein product [Brassica napus]|uniref:(rape) hypothetical protein n=1 Tax=Brassica napus TaxID=3708 RepID=A0A816LKI2_BRANA|nr:unnamed protein product [Brassica napus]